MNIDDTIPIRFPCPECGREVVAQPELRGKSTTCRVCSQPVSVPQSEPLYPADRKRQSPSTHKGFDVLGGVLIIGGLLVCIANLITGELLVAAGAGIVPKSPVRNTIGVFTGYNDGQGTAERIQRPPFTSSG